MAGRRSGFRTRLAVIAAAAGVVAALASGLTGALVASPAAAAPPTGTSCKVFSSNTAPGATATLGKCSDHKDTGGGGTATTSAGAPVVITWNNGQTTTLDVASTTVITGNVCPVTEFEETAPVMVSTTPSITAVMTLRVFFCFGSGGAETIVPGTTLTIS
jgi:hypothetical protein